MQPNDLVNEVSDKKEINNEKEEQKTFPLEYVEKLRKECARYRTDLKKLQEMYERFSPDDLKEFKSSKEEAEKRASEDKNKKIENFITDTAKSFSAIAPNQIVALLKNEIDVNEDGIFVVKDTVDLNAKDFISNFLASNLHLVRNKNAKKGANTAQYANGMFSIEQVSKMTVEQYKTNRERILNSLSKNI